MRAYAHLAVKLRTNKPHLLHAALVHLTCLGIPEGATPAKTAVLDSAHPLAEQAINSVTTIRLEGGLVRPPLTQ